MNLNREQIQNYQQHLAGYEQTVAGLRDIPVPSFRDTPNYFNDEVNIRLSLASREATRVREYAQPGLTERARRSLIPAELAAAVDILVRRKGPHATENDTYMRDLALDVFEEAYPREEPAVYALLNGLAIARYKLHDQAQSGLNLLERGRESLRGQAQYRMQPELPTLNEVVKEFDPRLLYSSWARRDLFSAHNLPGLIQPRDVNQMFEVVTQFISANGLEALSFALDHKEDAFRQRVATIFRSAQTVAGYFAVCEEEENLISTPEMLRIPRRMEEYFASDAANARIRFISQL